MTDRSRHVTLPRPLRALAGRALEAVLNRVIALDPETCASLAKLEGRHVQLTLRGPDLNLVIVVREGKLKVQAPSDEAAALHVSATPGGVLGMALSAGDDGVAPGKVSIAGDADLARRLEKLARGYAPDIEEGFAHHFGDVLGVPLARALQKALAHVRDSGKHLVEDSADWLREEARIAVSADEMDEFLDDVDVLRERTERLEVRFNRWAARARPAS